MSVCTRHVGSYGLCVRGGQVLLVRKARGPYVGLLDLPGGGIEQGESPLDALHRELVEETGLAVATAAWLFAYSGVVEYVNAAGRDEGLHHLGFVWTVTLTTSAQPKDAPDGQDSLGAAWYDVETLSEADLSPLACDALRAFRALE